MQGPCQCCDQPICNPPTFTCDEVSASKTKCIQLNGFVDGSGNFYQGRCGSNYYDPAPNKYFRFQNFGHASDPSYCDPCASDEANCTCIDAGVDSLVSPCNIIATGPCHAGFGVRQFGEITLADLTDATTAAIPSYDGTFQVSECDGAARFLSSTGISLTLTRFKFKLVHAPTASCYLKVWLRLRFIPDGSYAGASDNVVQDYDDSVFPSGIYEWFGDPTDGGLCFADKTKPWNDVANEITSPDASDEIDEGDLTDVAGDADANGTLQIEVKKYSCLSSYTPADPNDDGSRPTPDNEPNGFPK